MMIYLVVGTLNVTLVVRTLIYWQEVTYDES